MPPKYMDLDKLLLYEPRRRGSLPYRFKDYEVTRKNILAQNVVNNNNNFHEEKSKLKKQPKAMLPTTEQKLNVQLVKTQTKHTNKNKVSKKNKLPSIITKAKNMDGHLKEIETCDKPNLVLHFYIKELLEKSIFSNTTETLRHRVRFNDCKPILNTWENYNVIYSVVNNTVTKSKRNNEINFFLRFQPIVLVQKLTRKLLSAYLPIPDKGSPMSLWKNVYLPKHVGKMETTKFKVNAIPETNNEPSLSFSFQDQNQEMSGTSSDHEEGSNAFPVFEEIEIEEDKSWFKDFNFNSF